ncbi:enolase C-terminal domain-like protein [Salegentibacter maritimus]|uniref:enolase C-terminal domain-like protein n=1 Tax=Salegentibacter maritimus TaxID=2794347 RepID=UPI0018E4D7E0|nr:enolase C-terminal domain-like protein [Salegentibacter maritimus]MBI6116812.1 fuconate dehydratase [Salegentibacter maritimus]
MKKVFALDKRYQLNDGAGSDAVHSTPNYAYAVCIIKTNSNIEGIGLAFTLGKGNDLVCKAIEHLSSHIEGKEINEMMRSFGSTYKKMADDPSYRWLGPHKGIIHLALAAIVNACYDLWAKSKGQPLWKLLIDLPSEELINTLDFSYIEDVLTRPEALQILNNANKEKAARKKILETGYPGYDTSVGWFNYEDEKIASNIKDTMDSGFTAMKLKVGGLDYKRDIRRAEMIRKIAGDNATIMFDANQQWNLPQAISMCESLKMLNPYWIEEPLHPDDVYGHVELAKEVDIKLALGEHVPNKVLFKNFLQSGSITFNQVDVVRVGGISEFILISLMSKKFNIPVVPHVGDMGQIHQHLVLFNHIALDHPALFLEYIPHLSSYFKNPACIENGHYRTPEFPGIGSDLLTY